VRILEETGQYALAYLTAATHNITEPGEEEGTFISTAERLATVMEEHNIPMPNVEANTAGKLLIPPTPIMRADNWPLISVTKDLFSQLLENPNQEIPEDPDVSGPKTGTDDAKGGGEKWGEDDDIFDDETPAKKEKEGSNDLDGGGDEGWYSRYILPSFLRKLTIMYCRRSMGRFRRRFGSWR
jgi:coatomer protein complex subunit alpha (xenin)